jgi:hypothetical protein
MDSQIRKHASEESSNEASHILQNPSINLPFFVVVPETCCKTVQDITGDRDLDRNDEKCRNLDTGKPSMIIGESADIILN